MLFRSPMTDTNGKTQSEVCGLAFSQLTVENQKILDFFQQKRESVVGSVFIPNT